MYISLFSHSHFFLKFETVKEISVPGVVFCMAVDTSGKFVWAGGNDKTIRIYDIEVIIGNALCLIS
jgi:WD40 repeat protein